MTAQQLMDQVRALNPAVYQDSVARRQKTYRPMTDEEYWGKVLESLEMTAAFQQRGRQAQADGEQLMARGLTEEETASALGRLGVD
jgi:hypothetical protein